MIAYVYRCYDSAGRLLYVGCSNDVDRRMGQHRAKATWFRYCVAVNTDGPFDRAEALRLEAEAIASESPFFNAQPEHHVSVQVHKAEAKRRLANLGIVPTTFDEWDAENGQGIYYVALRAVENEIRSQFDVVDDATRHGRYLAARAAA